MEERVLILIKVHFLAYYLFKQVSLYFLNLCVRKTKLFLSNEVLYMRLSSKEVWWINALAQEGLLGHYTVRTVINGCVFSESEMNGG